MHFFTAGVHPPMTTFPGRPSVQFGVKEGGAFCEMHRHCVVVVGRRREYANVIIVIYVHDMLNMYFIANLWACERGETQN